MQASMNDQDSASVNSSELQYVIRFRWGNGSGGSRSVRHVTWQRGKHVVRNGKRMNGRTLWEFLRTRRYALWRVFGGRIEKRQQRQNEERKERAREKWKVERKGGKGLKGGGWPRFESLVTLFFVRPSPVNNSWTLSCVIGSNVSPTRQGKSV